MTKKDYVKFAEMLRRLRGLCKDKDNPLGVHTLNVVEGELWELFTEDNALFDVDKFAKASGRYDA